MVFEPPITPAPPPREPFDVPTSPSSPPAEPFDVPTFPADPPAGTFDVPTVPSPPPGGTFDVPVTSPPGPPPVRDVPTVPAPPPIGPTDVPIEPAGPPAGPVDVPVTPPPPPSAPIDVDVGASPPPSAPADVPIVASPGPAVPFDVPITPAPPVLVIDQTPGRPPTIDQIISSVIGFDGALASFLSSIVEIDPITADGPGGGALDPRALARWFDDYRKTVGAAGVAQFISEQSVLYAMNPLVNRIFDPTYFLRMMVPGSMGNVRPALDSEGGLTMEVVARAQDDIIKAAVQANPLKPNGDGLGSSQDLHGPDTPYTSGQAISVDSMVDSVLDGGQGSPFLRDVGGVMRFDASAFFEERASDGSMTVRATTRARAASGVENVMSSRLAASAATDGIIRVGLTGEESDGSVLSTTQDPSDVVDDDDARVPISFTDLRQVPGQRYRSIYFRPENVQLATSFSPEYSESTAFGRTDPVIGYQNTRRIINLSFDVHVMAPEDLQRTYNKMLWLQSMVYPSFGADSLMQSGPVVRMRIGDLIATDLGGVPGVIRSLGFDFSDAMWELRRGMKVPLRYRVQIDFLVLHDGPVGSVNGVFGVFSLPAGGGASDRNTNLAGGPQDSRSTAPQGVTAAPGRFFRFGEPRRQ